MDGDIKRRYGGTGLGLSIVKNLVEIQGSEIKVDSVLGQGTVFHFELEYMDTGIKTTGVGKEHKNIHADFAGDCKVLIVEDNSMNRRYLSTLLNKWNVQNKMAVNGREGVEMAQLEHFDLIFMDIQMPEMDGYEATINIRSAANPNRETPIVALTASAMLSRKDKAFNVGMNDYVSKPFTPEQILPVLEHFLGVKGAIQGLSDEGEGPLIAPAPIIDAPASMKKLDQERLNDLYGDDHEYAYDMFDAFQEKMRDEYPQLEQLYHQKAWDALSKLAHKLKPAFPMVGLTELEADFQRLEGSAKTGADEQELGYIINKIEDKLKTGLPLVNAEMQRLRELVG